MTLTEAVQRVWLKTDRKTSAPSTAKKDIITGLLNYYKDVWFDEPNVYWNSTREYVELGPVTATDSFTLTNIDKVSQREGDYIYIDNTDGTESRYSLVPANKLHDDPNHHVAAIQNGSLVFPSAFTATSREFGGTIRIPTYTRPADMSADSDEIPVDNPYYIIARAAAEYVSNDVTKSYRAPDFIAEATEAMNQMKADNNAQVEEIEVDAAPIYSGQSWD